MTATLGITSATDRDDLLFRSLQGPTVPPVSLIGLRAHRLAILASEELPVRAAQVLTTVGVQRAVGSTGGLDEAIRAPHDAGSGLTSVERALHGIWTGVAHGGLAPLDLWLAPTEGTILSAHVAAADIADWGSFVYAMRRLLAAGPNDHDFAVVAQRHITTASTGSAQRLDGLLASIEVTIADKDGPDSGPITIGPYGRLVRPRSAKLPLDRHLRHRLAHLVRKAEHALGMSVRLDWSLDKSGFLWIIGVTPAGEQLPAGADVDLREAESGLRTFS